MTRSFDQKCPHSGQNCLQTSLPTHVAVEFEFDNSLPPARVKILADVEALRQSVMRRSKNMYIILHTLHYISLSAVLSHEKHLCVLITRAGINVNFLNK